MIIDAHTHIGKLKNSPYEKQSYEENLDSLLKEMKKSGVDHSLILANYNEADDVSPSTEAVLRVAKNLKNISVVGSVDVLNYKKEDLKKLEASLIRKEIVGIKLYLGYQHFYANDAIARPILELCDRLGVPVIFHTGDTLIYKSFAKVKYAQPLPVDDVAVDFPNLKIIIAHMGNPWLMDCAEILYRNKNVYADVSGLFVHGGLDGKYAKMMLGKIKELAIFSDPKKLLFGTDWPLAGQKEYIGFVKKLGISKKDLEFVMWKNASELFGIKLV